MFENTPEFVGHAMHEALLARAIPNQRLALMKMAARIAPTASPGGVAPAR